MKTSLDMARASFHQACFFHGLLLFGGQNGREAVNGAAGGRPMDLLSALLIRVESSDLAGLLALDMQEFVEAITRSSTRFLLTLLNP